MKTKSLKTGIALCVLTVLASTGVATAQTTENAPSKKVNFGYSQNPKTKVKQDPANQENQTPVEAPVNNQTTQDTTPQSETSTTETIAQKTLEVVKKASRKTLAPTENYQVGAGDILFINLQNAPKSATLFTVLNDGTIDYPLAGELVSVAGLSTDEIEEILREKIKLYENPQVSVKVRDYQSHKITVLGLVEKPGEKFIQREAVPMFVVRAEAIVKSNAGRVVIKRADGTTLALDMKDENYQNALVFSGDIVEFTSVQELSGKSEEARFFFIGGEIATAGQRDFHDGLTLTQAILAAGGLKKESVKKVVIRRRNQEGLLISTEYNLKLIKDGKIPDPRLEAGDTVEVGN